MLGHSYSEKKNKCSVAQSFLNLDETVRVHWRIYKKNYRHGICMRIVPSPLGPNRYVQFVHFPPKNLSNMYAKIKAKLWSDTMRPKARGLVQHGGPSGWLEESDPALPLAFSIPYRLP